MDKKILVLLVLIALLMPLLPSAFADGMGFYRPHSVVVSPEPDLTEGEWKLLAERGQTALIDYENGKEYLTIAINVEKADAEEAIWIFPIPADPDKTNLNMNAEIPPFFGDEVYTKAGEKIWGFTNGMRNTLGLPLLADALSKVSESSVWSMTMGMSASASAYRDYEKQITVHQKRELFGISAEVISAETGSAIRSYLQSKGFSIPQSAVGMLDSYVGQDYAFVIAHISDFAAFSEHQGDLDEYLMAVSVVFPTDRIYFPLKPTSIYGAEEIPLGIYVSGHVSPDLFGSLANSRFTEVKYYLNDDPNNELQRSFTRIKINVPASFFDQDLWIDVFTPLDVGIAESIVFNEYVWFIIFLAGVSVLASLFMGNIVFIGKRPDQKVLVLMGLSNVLTIVPFMLFVIFWDFDKGRLNGKWEDDKKARIKKRDKLIFIACFIAFFVVLTYVIEAAWGVAPRERTIDVYYDYYQAASACGANFCSSDFDCQTAEGCVQFEEAACNDGRCEALGDFSSTPHV